MGSARPSNPMGFIWSKLTGGPQPVVELDHVTCCNSANSESGSSADSAAGPPTQQEVRRLIELLEGGQWESAPPPSPLPLVRSRPRFHHED